MTPLYDPMVAKLIVWDVDREHATRRMLRALGEYEIEPLTTLIPFHKAVLATEQWANGATFRDQIEDKKWLKTPGAARRRRARRGRGRRGADASATYKVEVNGRLHSVKVIGARRRRGGGAGAAAKRPPKRERKAGGGGGGERHDARLAASGHGVQGGRREGRGGRGGRPDLRDRGDEDGERDHRPQAGKVTALSVAEGAAVNAGDLIAMIE